MKYSIKHLFHIDSPKQKVYKALTSIEGLSNWWTVETSGDTSPGSVITFLFNGTGPEMKVIDQQSDEFVKWECIESPHGWLGHSFLFQLDENESKTRVRFSHSGWLEQGDFYAICSFSWGRYMESLRQYCQTGTGKAFGSENYL